MKKALAGCAIVLIALSSLLWFMLFSEKGLQLLVHYGQELSKGSVKIESSVGKLGNSFTLSDLFYSTGGVSLKVNHIQVSWHPLALLRGEFHLIDLFVDGVKLTTMAEGQKVKSGRDGFALPEIALPLTVVLKRIEIENIEILSGSNPVTRIDRAVLAMVVRDDTIEISTLSLKAGDNEIDLAGSVGMQKDWPVKINGKWNVEAVGFPGATGICSLSGSVNKGRLKLEVDTPFSAELSTDYSLSEGVKWHLSLISREVNPEIFHKDFPGKLDLDVAVKGQYVKGDISADIEIRKIEGDLIGYPLMMQSAARFANGYLNITKALVKSGDSELIVKGRVARHLDLEFNFDSPDIRGIVPQLAGHIQAEGSISSHWQRPVVKADVQGVDVRGFGGTVDLLRVSIDGGLHREGITNTEISIKNIQKDKTHIDQALLKLSGGIENHHIQLWLTEKEKELFLLANGKIAKKSWSGEIRDLLYSVSSVDLVRLGKSAQLQISEKKSVLDEMCVIHEGGKICLDGQWYEEKWQAGVQLFGFDPAFLLENLSGKIDGKLIGNGDFSQNGGSHTIQLQSLSGDLNGETIHGGGYVQVAKGNLNCKEFFLKFGNADLRVEGTLGDTFNLSFSGVVPDLGEIHPKSGGYLSVNGNLKGDRTLPILDLNFVAQNGKFAKHSLKEISGDIEIDLNPEGKINSDITVSGISTEFLSVDEGHFQVEGTAINHKYKLTASTSKGDLRLQGEGSYETSWKGILNNLSLLSDDYGEWYLKGDVRAVFGAIENRVEDFCLHSDKAELCVNANFDANKNWGLDFDLTSLHLSILNDFKLLSSPIEGLLQGKITVKGKEKMITALHVESSVPDLLISETIDEETHSYSLNNSSFSMHLIENILDCSLQSEFQGNSKFIGKVQLKGANDLKSDFGTLPVDGTIAFNVNDLTLVNILSKSMVKADGKLKGEINISGMLAKSAIKGDLVLQEGGVDIPSLGISINDLAVELAVVNDIVNFDYSGKSGEGKIQGKGSYSRDVNGLWQMNTDISGSNFDLLATEKFKIRVDPDLHFAIDQDSGRLWGELQIPYARIASLGGSGASSPSDDVVFIDDLDSEQHKKRLFTTEVVINLGDDIQIDAFGLKSYLTGKLELKHIPQKTLTAIGELVVKDGKFALYGVELDINRGRLLFAGGPVDNPGVDFQAQRKIEKKTVGVNVSGTVNDLEFQLFSDPVMEETEVLALMLVGKSMISSSDDDQSLIGTAATALGIGGANKIFGKLGEFISLDEIYLDGGKDSEDISVVLGKNLTKNLFIGYDHNFFDSTGDFKVRYDLGGGFSVETKSSADATSGDILYSIER